MSDLDKIDRKILRYLQTDGRMSNADIAAQVNVSAATCHRRIQRLFDEGIIDGVSARVRPEAVDLGVLVLVGAILDQSTPESFADFEAEIARFPFVLECHCVAGDFDYFLKIRVKDIADFNNRHRAQLLTLPNVRQLRSFFVLKEVIEKAYLHF
ncbi:leucine-responsive regulatory protein [Roseibium sp. TrichSKD4]|uniref:Lrp/AsnC family transcriptional regulator n=1 Tax=Roseibium sp. TrichSKD4 TaxID=744980 RepID=UPI0001E56E1A|nr:Lrp/AsnC family transcriptional regulator [Roseibium sp. TrichSKD4]EFO31557.1 leucine-responsive regulatory protein [Roseibium sp. TrichSKD4]